MHVDNIHWLGHASFRIQDGTSQIYIDPWKLPPGLPKATLVLITHGHFDHLSPDDIGLIEQPGTIFVGPAAVTATLKSKHVVTAAAGGRYTAGPFTVEAVAAYNIGKDFHPRPDGGLGYVVSLSDGTRVYHAGDTDVTPEMKALSGIDVALMPCGGTYTMTASEMAAAANAFKPKVLIPMHWGDIVGSKADADTVAKAFTGTTIIKTPER